jgi:hypothetical protein
LRWCAEEMWQAVGLSVCRFDGKQALWRLMFFILLFS